MIKLDTLLLYTYTYNTHCSVCKPCKNCKKMRCFLKTAGKSFTRPPVATVATQLQLKCFTICKLVHPLCIALADGGTLLSLLDNLITGLHSLLSQISYSKCVCFISATFKTKMLIISPQSSIQSKLCRDRCDQRSCKTFARCEFFSENSSFSCIFAHY